MNDAEIHAKIAAKVKPDARADVMSERGSDDYPVKRCMLNGRQVFDLLETDSTGEPTMQAKASALDVLVWLVEANIGIDKLCDLADSGFSPTAIFNAAKEALDEH